jgi:hypothetical protein
MKRSNPRKLIASRKLGVSLLLAASSIVWANEPPAVILTVDIENLVIYDQDTGDATKFATSPTVVPSMAHRSFVPQMWVADVVAVNGKPSKGTWTAWAAILFRTTTPTPGAAIADGVSTGQWDQVLDILQEDGTPIGTIMGIGWNGTPIPPGAPTSCLMVNSAIVGGTGAFLGVRGQFAQCGNFVNPRIASVVEDPANRRINGGGKRRMIYHLLPMARPEVIDTLNGPAVVHATDFSLVTAANPARSGEILSLLAAGLGPTRPGVDPGQPFPASPLQVVNSPVEVTVNGAPAQVLYAGGYPGTTNSYQVNFRLPDGTAPGLAAIALTAGFIPGSEVQIPTK